MGLARETQPDSQGFALMSYRSPYLSPQNTQLGGYYIDLITLRSFSKCFQAHQENHKQS